MKLAVILCLGVAMVSAIDLRMCLRNCRMNDHYCKWTGAPGQMGNFCMQKNDECKVGCIQMCKKGCNEKFTTGTCVSECQYRGQMMVEMGMNFNGKKCMDHCMWQANQCNRRCDDAFRRLFLDSPLMEYVYPEMENEDWTVRSGLMENPQEEQSEYPPFLSRKRQ